ncbi:secreted protein, partial [Candidatus Magnetomorum sp. HK-1]
MKTIDFKTKVILTVIWTFFSISSHAETIGNPASNLGAGSVEISFGYDLGKADIDVDIYGYNHESEYDWNAYYLRGNYSISNNIKLMTQFGIVDINSEERLLDIFGGLDTPKIDFDSDLFYGVGFDAVVFEQDKFKVGLLFQINKYDTNMNAYNYLSLFPDSPELNSNWSSNINVSGLRYFLSVGCSYQINKQFVPS